MPWRIYKIDNQWCVHKLTPRGNRGRREGCHATRTDAERQLRALRASEARRNQRRQ